MRGLETHPRTRPRPPRTVQDFRSPRPAHPLKKILNSLSQCPQLHHHEDGIKNNLRILRENGTRDDRLLREGHQIARRGMVSGILKIN